MQQEWIKYGLGIDVSKSHFHGCLMTMNAEGRVKVVATRKFTQNQAGFSGLLEWLASHRKDSALPFQVIMEVTGVYHEQLLHYLYAQGLPAGLILPRQSKDYRKSLGFHSKNDKLDGKALAHWALHRKTTCWQPISPHIYQIRSLMRLRRSLIQNKVAMRNQLHALAHAYHDHQAVATALQQLIEQLDQQITTVEAQAKALAQADEPLWENLQRIQTSLTGVGLITLLEVMSETNGFTDFHSVKQLISYAGYDIIENQSGTFHGKTRISKNGNGRLRRALYMAALVIIRNKVAPFYALYERVLQRNPGIKKKAQVAVQRKLLAYLYTLWKTKQAFDPLYAIKHSNQNESSAEMIPALHGIDNQMIELPISLASEK